MNRSLRAAASILVTAFLLAALPSPGAEGSDLDDLRKKGVIGERYDGLATVRAESADAAARTLVDSVNAKRREIYEASAKKQGVAAAEVGKVYALELSKKAPAGTWFLGEDGKWAQKK